MCVREFVVPVCDGMKRRGTRDLRSGVLLDDLWVSGRTPHRAICKQLNVPRDIETTIESVDAVEDEGGETLSWDDQQMRPAEATQYRALVARLNFLSIDMPDLQFCCKEAARHMATPCNCDCRMLKRVGGYLVGRPRVAHLYQWQEALEYMHVYADSNWAGCVTTRKSTTGFCITNGSHLIRSLSKTQSNIALSSAEAELYAITAAAGEGLGAKAMCADFGTPMGVYLHVDASAAIGVAQRKGLGKIRHLDTQPLWIQDAARQKRLSLLKVPGTENPADLMTKPLDSATQDKLMLKFGLAVLEGRAASAPKLTSSFDGDVGGDDALEAEVDSFDVVCDVESDETSGWNKVCIDQDNIDDGLPWFLDKVCIDQGNIADGLPSFLDKVCIDLGNIADGLPSFLDKVCIDQGNIADGSDLQLDKVCIDQDNIADGLSRPSSFRDSGNMIISS